MLALEPSQPTFTTLNAFCRHTSADLSRTKNASHSVVQIKDSEWVAHLTDFNKSVLQVIHQVGQQNQSVMIHSRVIIKDTEWLMFSVL